MIRKRLETYMKRPKTYMKRPKTYMGNMDKKTDRLGMMVAVLFIGFCLGAFLANRCNHFVGTNKIVADTVVVRDTVRSTMPTEKDSKVVGTAVLPLVPSTLREGRNVGKLTDGKSVSGVFDDAAMDARNGGEIGVSDTVWATVPRTQKRYEDSTYTAWVSGYEPRLDSIEVYRRTVTIEKREERRVRNKRFSIGLTGGFGYGVFTGKPDVFLGIGATWRIF